MNAHILVVEDDNQSRLSVVAVLSYAGYQVTSASSGEAAIELLTQHTFDAIVTDIRMGDIDGLQVLSASKRQPEPPSVILLTGHASLDTAITALRNGAADYLLKPCEPADLQASVASALRRRAEDLYLADAARIISQGLAWLQRRPSVDEPGAESLRPPEHTTPWQVEETIVIAALRIGRSRHTATFDNQPLHLTPVEYALLRCLAEIHGQVLSYSQIVQRTHGFDTSNADAQTLLKAHVRNLRHKIGPGYLINVRGAGYKLIAPAPAADR